MLLTHTPKGDSRIRDAGRKGARTANSVCVPVGRFNCHWGSRYLLLHDQHVRTDVFQRNRIPQLKGFYASCGLTAHPQRPLLRIIPPTIVIYIIAYMDRMNISFAIAGGMDKSLGLS